MILRSASEAAAAIAAGKLTSEALVSECLERVRRREEEVRAWAYIDPECALAQARERDRDTPRSRLHGIPVGVKDVIDTCDLPTEYGSPIYRGHRPACDAACVAQVRELGGVILGKTVSTEFATRHPNKTRNPRNLAHTPGGSSSGSAAAVADGMVPIAFGTQTSSSIVRPAAFCGVVGYKPTFNLINRAGLKFLAESMDTIGTLTRTVADAALVVEELTGMPHTSFDDVAALHPRIGFCRTPYWAQADAASQSMIEAAVRRLAARGARVSEITLDPEFDLAQTQIEVSSYEFFRALTHERTRFPALISESLTARIAAGGQVTRAQYEAGLARTARCRERMVDLFRECDGLIAPSAPGEAPRGLERTGEPIFGLMWTLLGLPCITLPCGAGPNGLPLGVQLIGRHGGDAGLFVIAEWVRRSVE
ncbi:MAG TPA: amidase [Burkholderiales bacterium]|nr:amidase [Burkholderiales bacterium]